MLGRIDRLLDEVEFEPDAIIVMPRETWKQHMKDLGFTFTDAELDEQYDASIRILNAA